MEKIICIITTVLLAISGYFCQQSPKDKIKVTNNSHYACCNIKISPERAASIDSLSKYLYIGYLKGGEFIDYAMHIEYYMRGTYEFITTSIDFHSNVFDKNGKEKVFYIRDTIHDYLTISHFVDSLKRCNPLLLDCIKGYDGYNNSKGAVDVYYKTKSSSNCFSISDTNSTLIDSKYLFYLTIFNNREFFSILLQDIQKRRIGIFDSLMETEKIGR